MKTLLKLNRFIFLGKLVFLTMTLSLFFPNMSAAAENWVQHVVISEIRIEGATATDEFVELYNPTDRAVSLQGWKLKKKTSSGTESNLLTSFPDGASIPAYGYYLITHATGYTLSVQADAKYSSSSYSLANNNTVLLYDNLLNLVDKVGWGSALDYEQSAIASIASGKSVHRKPNDGYGNGVDSDNNAEDFVSGDSNPQNTASQSQPPRQEYENAAPSLSWVGSTGYENDGVDPDFGFFGVYFFKVTYKDFDNDPPKFLKIYFDENLDGELDESEQFVMWEEDLQDTNYIDGKVYVYEIEILKVGEFRYKFVASDGQFFASGEPTLEKAGPQVCEKNIAPLVEFSNITENEVFESEIDIFWEVQDENQEQEHTFDLWYSHNDENWIKIVEKLKTHSYRWDISALENGAYKLRITVTDSGNPPLSDEGLSPPFFIQNIKAGSVVLNEVLFDPPQTGTDTAWEWVELYNPQDFELILSGWQICDYVECDVLPRVTLGAKSYWVLHPTDLPDKSIGNGLSNSADCVKLKSAKGVEVSSTSWSSPAPRNLSWARRDDGSWAFSSSLTPGSANDFAGEEEKDDSEEETEQPTPAVTQTTLEEIRALPLGTLVSVEGIVSVEPGILGSQIFYIQGSPGVQIYSYSGKFPNLSEGDRIRVVGELSSAGGELRVKISKISDVSLLGKGYSLEVINSPTGSIDESLEGHLVLVEGIVIQDSGDTFYLDDGSGAIKIYIKDSTGISVDVKKGDRVKVRGIVSQTSSGYRILPRRPADVIVVTRVAKTKTIKTKVAKAKASKTKTASSKTKKSVKLDTAADKVLKNSQNFWAIGSLTLILLILGAVWWFFFREKTPGDMN